MTGSPSNAVTLRDVIRSADLRRLTEDAGCDFHQHGEQLRSTCPLHNGENETAFVIYPETTNAPARWHCFRCVKSGDALDFYMAWKGIAPTDFDRGIEEFCRYLGIETNWKRDPQKLDEIKQQRLRETVLEEARKFYAGQLWAPEGAAAFEYLRRRGLSDQTIRDLGLGYTDSGQRMYVHLQECGFDLDLVTKSGLIRQLDHDDFTANSDGKHHGPYGYIIFPHLVYGRCIYLTSRRVEPLGKDLPDTKSQNKSRNLPGSSVVYRAETKGKAAGMVVVVEGSMDAATLFQLGFSAWGMGGLKGLSDGEIEDLKHKSGYYLAVDNDVAGQEKIENIESKLVTLCKKLGPNTMITPILPIGKDFNEWLQKVPDLKPDAVNDLLKKAVTWYEKRLAQAKECPPYERDERYLEIGQMIASAPESSRSWFYRRAQDILGMSKAEVKELLTTATRRNDGYVLSKILNRRLTFLDTPLGNFWARITHELSLDDGLNQPEVHFTINGGLDSGDPLPSIEIDAAEFYGMQWIPRLWGARPIIYVPRGKLFELARAIQEVSTEMAREQVYTHTGWTEKGGQRGYLTGSGMITATGLDLSTHVDLGPNNLRYYDLPAPPEADEAFQAVRASLDFLQIGNRSVTSMLWAAMYAAPLSSILPLYAVLWVYGQSQTGKSTITHLALTHFGARWIDGRMYHAPIEFSNSSYAAIENAAFVTKDVPLVIDDFAPQFASKGEAMNLHRIAHAVVRIVGNRSGKGRSQANLKEQLTRTPRGFVMATAENPLTGQSTVGRLIYLPVARGDIIFEGGKINDRLNEAQSQGKAGLYAKAMAVYVRWLAEHWEEVETDLKSRADGLATGMRREYPNIQNRLPDYFGLLAAAQDIALEAFEDMGYISLHERRALSDANREAICRTVVQQAEAISAESPVRKVFTALGSLLQSRRGYLTSRKKPLSRTLENGEKVEDQDLTQEGKPLPDHTSAKHLGWYEPLNKRTLWFETETILAEAKAYWRTLDENLDITPDMLRRQIEQAGVLSEKGDGAHLEKKVYIRGVVKRVLVVSVSSVESLYEVQLLPDMDKEDEA